MEFLSDLSSIDLFIVLCLAAGVFAGFTQGMIRYAAELRGGAGRVRRRVAACATRCSTLLTFWQAFTPELRAADRLPGAVHRPADRRLVRGARHLAAEPAADPKQLDEIGGAVLGVLFVALVITFLMVVLDSFFLTAPDAATVGARAASATSIEAMDASVLVDFFRAALMPTFGAHPRPLLPDDIADLLVAP